MSLMEGISTLNSAVRTVLAVGVLAIAGVAGWFGYQEYNADAISLKEKEKALETAQLELDEKNRLLASAQEKVGVLTKDVARQKKEIEKLSTSLRLLKMNRRLAEIVVTEQKTDEDGQLYTTIRFTETNDDGDAITEPRTFRLKGDMVYIDYWTVTFDDKYIENKDIERGTSICLLKQIFGAPGPSPTVYPLDEPGERPAAYARGEEVSEFEKKIWSDFWDIANDRERAEELGITHAFGVAANTQLRKGKTYKLDIRSTGTPRILPAQDTQVQVYGKVSVDGKPLEMGSISFLPVDGDSVESIAAEIKDGTYRVTLPPGRKNVSIQGFRMLNSDSGGSVIEQFLPAKYNASTSLVADISIANNSIDFELTTD